MIRLENVKAGTIKRGVLWVRFEEFVRDAAGRRVIDGERYLTVQRKVSVLAWAGAR